jgi:MFS family permease
MENTGTSSDRSGLAAPEQTRRAALATASGAHFVHDGIADSLYVLLPFWAQALGLSYTQVGSLKTAFSAAMAIFQMPAGLLAERIGERTLLAVGTLITGVAFGALTYAGNYPALLLLLLAVGIGSAVQHPLASSIIARAYGAGARRAALGVYNFAGDAGKMVVAFVIAMAAGLIGWRMSVLGYGVIVAVVGVILLVVLQRLAIGARVPLADAASAEASSSKPDGWGFSNARGYSILSAIHVLDAAGRTGCLTLLPFLLLQKDAASATVGLALALIFAGGAAGKLSCGLLAERLGLLRTVALTEVGTAALLLVIIIAPLPIAMACMPILGVALNGTSSVLYGTVTEFVHAERQARAFGLFYTLGSAAGGSSPLIFGLVSDSLGVPAALACIAAMVLATLPLTLLLNPHLPEERAAG